MRVESYINLSNSWTWPVNFTCDRYNFCLLVFKISLRLCSGLTLSFCMNEKVSRQIAGTKRNAISCVHAVYWSQSELRFFLRFWWITFHFPFSHGILSRKNRKDAVGVYKQLLSPPLSLPLFHQRRKLRSCAFGSISLTHTTCINWKCRRYSVVRRSSSSKVDGNGAWEILWQSKNKTCKPACKWLVSR